MLELIAAHPEPGGHRSVSRVFLPISVRSAESTHRREAVTKIFYNVEFKILNSAALAAFILDGGWHPISGISDGLPQLLFCTRPRA